MLCISEVLGACFNGKMFLCTTECHCVVSSCVCLKKHVPKTIDDISVNSIAQKLLSTATFTLMKGQFGILNSLCQCVDIQPAFMLYPLLYGGDLSEVFLVLSYIVLFTHKLRL
ncbi:hypothetical protein ABID23_000659 [Bartonella silvatica]|uniref:Uncharacterized protein n=1 Tax=Bartonella silvatica TaxID=357760 RepID=A0ABV2HG96_9HYPH